MHFLFQSTKDVQERNEVEVVTMTYESNTQHIQLAIAGSSLTQTPVNFLKKMNNFDFGTSMHSCAAQTKGSSNISDSTYLSFPVRPKAETCFSEFKVGDGVDKVMVSCVE